MRHPWLAIAAVTPLLFGLAGCSLSMQFSPDGKKLLYTSKDGIEVADSDGRNRHLIPRTRKAECASWSPDDRYVLFRRATSSGNEKKLVLYDIATGKDTVIANSSDLEPPFAWSPHAKRIACISVSDKMQPRLVRVSLAGIERVITPLPVDSVDPGGFENRMMWIPGTDEVALIGKHGQDRYDVYVAGAGTVRQVSTSGQVSSIALANDSHTLIWAMPTEPSGHTQVKLYAYDLVTHTARKLPFDDPMSTTNPRRGYRLADGPWPILAPDGSAVALLARYRRQGVSAKHERSIFVVVACDVRGHGARLLAATPPSAEKNEGFVFPTISPGGKRIAIFEGHGHRMTMTVYDRNGAIVSRVSARGT